MMSNRTCQPHEPAAIENLRAFKDAGFPIRRDRTLSAPGIVIVQLIFDYRLLVKLANDYELAIWRDSALLYFPALR